MSEDALEQITLEILVELGWSHVYGPDIAPGEPLAERNDYRETILEGRLANAISRLNPSLSSEAVADVVTAVKRADSQVVESENWRAYRYLIDGVPVEFRDGEQTLRTVRARLVDWDDPYTNDLVAVNQFTVQGPRRERRPDIVLFVNGLPLGLFELKRPGKEYASIKGAWRQVQTYRSQIGDIFKWNQIVVLSDGIQARAGSFSAAWEHYAPWKTITGIEAPQVLGRSYTGSGSRLRAA